MKSPRSEYPDSVRASSLSNCLEFCCPNSKWFDRDYAVIFTKEKSDSHPKVSVVVFVRSFGKLVVESTIEAVVSETKWNDSEDAEKLGYLLSIPIYSVYFAR